MKKLVAGILAVMLCLTLSAKKIEPIKTNIGKLNISIDPRLELLGAVQITADYPMATKDTPYSEAVKEYFKNMKGSKAVQMTQSLLKDHHFSYDAPATIMLLCRSLMV